MKNSKKAVIIYGPPGSGKGTQAKLLADKLGFFHFDTGEYLRKILHDPKLQKNKTIREERKLNDSGKLNTPSWVLRIVSQKVKELNKLGQSIIFSGSPRTFFEAFGDKKHPGIYKLLEKMYGKKNIYIFLLDIPREYSIKRNTKRRICSICKTPILNLKIKINSCPFCGGRLVSRRDDKKEVILIRLKEYETRTLTIAKELNKKKFKIIKIDGKLKPYKVHEKIVSNIRK